MMKAADNILQTPSSDSRRRSLQAVPIGELLRQWRGARRLSQLDLALDAGISTRHLSCVETGKAEPSREMIARLADTLDMPLRERNLLLMAAGYTPEYAETPLNNPELTPVRRAIEFILEHQEPYPAFAMNRCWDVLQENRAASRVSGFLGGGSTHDNMMRRFFDPDDLRAVVLNWEEVAGDLMRHLHDEIATYPSDSSLRALLEEVLSYPGVPWRWRTRQLGATPPPLLTVVFGKDDDEFRFFSTITRFGTPRDVTIDELRIECTFAADEATARLCRWLAQKTRAASASEDLTRFE
jgi:transcriptional regulator with XRE-family HTH domain